MFKRTANGMTKKYEKSKMIVKFQVNLEENVKLNMVLN